MRPLVDRLYAELVQCPHYYAAKWSQGGPGMSYTIFGTDVVFSFRPAVQPTRAELSLNSSEQHVHNLD